MTPIPIPQIVEQLSGLSPERIAEVYDFVLFLKSRQEKLDESDEWSDQDMRDAANASLAYAEATGMMEEPSDDAAG